MEQTWRWYGPNDPVTLKHIRQAGATGIVTGLHEIPIGDIWPLEAVQARQSLIQSAGLDWSVVESIPIHESIKIGSKDRDVYIRNYKESIKNVVKGSKVKIFCYNFMPVVDWTRTELDFNWHDDSKALKFDMIAFCAFDVFILRRSGAENDYDETVLKEGEKYFKNLNEEQKKTLVKTIIQGLPGRTSEKYSLDSFRKALSAYEQIDEDQARSNLTYFISQIGPLCRDSGAFLAIHPDDPPISLLGLPRVVSSSRDVRLLLNSFNSPHNGLTMCVGSYASRKDNDVLHMIDEFKDKINFVHLRNVEKLDGFGSFVESDHLDGDVDMYQVIKKLLNEKTNRERNRECAARLMLPMRPDHGHQMLDDLNSEKKTNPGYTGIGRLRGLAELRGLQMGIIKSQAI